MTNLTDPLAEDWRRPRPSASGYRADAWVAIVVAAVTALSVLLTRTAGVLSDSPWWLAGLWVVFIALPLAMRRRWPEAVAVVIALSFYIGATLGVGDQLFSNICLYIAIFAVGAWSQNRTAGKWVRIAIIAGMFIWLFWQLIFQANQASALLELSRDGFFSPYAAYGVLQVLINLLYFGAAYYFGDSAWQSAHRKAALVSRTRELADERERSAAQAVALERVRIARELHDVVAHHVSVMGVQAGAARRILDRDPARAAQALTVIEQSARTAVEELHTMLGALRSDEDSRTDGLEISQTTSTRGIAQLEELAEESRAAGVPVQVSVIGEPREVPGIVGLSIYRIAQEALTNTRKHAGTGARAELRLRYETDAIELEVTDDGVGPQPTREVRSGRSGIGSTDTGTDTGTSGTGSASSAGLGQLGMRERVSAVGGELQLGARPRGGYLVRARFPVAGRESA